MIERNEIWVVDDDRAIRWVLERALAKVGLNSKSFENADKVLPELDKERPRAIISDIRMPGTDGLVMLKEIHTRMPDLPVIIMTAYADLDRAVAAFQSGAFEYLPKPFDLDDAVAIVHRAIKRHDEGAFAAPQLTAAGPSTEIIGSAPAMQEVFRAIGRLSRSNMTVLLTGESGTGKELVAAALHRHSPRADHTFIALNTAAIPRDLLESEFFGHERGSFTGAVNQRVGRFEQAHGGTLFLDEIGDMPADLQISLLRVLADGEFYRVGAHQPICVDVRVIAATHQDLEQRTRDGTFREDLFHRLNVIRLRIPPLRERIEDLPLLCDHFMHATAMELDIETKVLAPETLDLLSRYSWPGNVRELENTCRWLSVMSASQMIHPEDLPVEFREPKVTTNMAGGGDWRAVLTRWVELRIEQGESGILSEIAPEFERILITVALHKTGGRRQDAAKLLGLGRNTLTRKIKDLHIDL